MTDFDVIVLGGGPAGYTAALTAAEQGAMVALVESERPGGACVFFSCIPTNALRGVAQPFLAARELDALGIMQAGEQFALGRAADRAQALVRSVGEGVVAALASRKVAVLRARGTLTGPDSVALTGEERRELRA